ncbi:MULTISPECIES: hydroxyphenylacetyl-CoA thioesterase PaaI [unclassified Pseudonocardia]|uniref:hydroxyphenylacetyl-CoA thioesterase PaaI n=1 Tax=unclassified Pseudonocardia TaxID=2619320 RepID=UPI0001FFF0EA
MSETGTTDPQRTAEESAAAMRAADHAARAAGVEIVDVGPGRAVATMTVSGEHANGHGVCHGGYLFLLADSAMAYACNAYGVSALATGADIAFLRPAATGDVLTAEAVERSLAGRSGLYDVTVRTGDGTVVAEFRGRTRLVPGLAAPPPVSG